MYRLLAKADSSRRHQSEVWRSMLFHTLWMTIGPNIRRYNGRPFCETQGVDRIRKREISKIITPLKRPSHWWTRLDEHIVVLGETSSCLRLLIESAISVSDKNTRSSSTIGWGDQNTPKTLHPTTHIVCVPYRTWDAQGFFSFIETICTNL